jgi:hypothetical protein
MTARLHWWKEKADPVGREQRREEKRREGFNTRNRPAKSGNHNIPKH